MGGKNYSPLFYEKIEIRRFACYFLKNKCQFQSVTLIKIRIYRKHQQVIRLLLILNDFLNGTFTGVLKSNF
jgi:hypothetical protein